MSKESFKLFVRKHPELIDFVSKGEMSWQKFYDIYDLYGEDNDAWSKYLKKSNIDGDFKFSDVIKYLKNVDMDTLQKGVTGVSKAINLIKQLGIGASANSVVDTYEPRPLYKSFDD